MNGNGNYREPDRGVSIGRYLALTGALGHFNPAISGRVGSGRVTSCELGQELFLSSYLDGRSEVTRIPSTQVFVSLGKYLSPPRGYSLLLLEENPIPVTLQHIRADNA